MKSNRIWMLPVVCLLMILATSCSKSEYFTDGGVHTANTPLSNYDYLKQHSWKSFDSMLLIVDYFGLKEELNNAPTVFAVTNYSISKYVALLKTQRDENLPFTIDTLCKGLSADSVRQYFLGQKITLDNAASTITAGSSLGKTSCAVVKEMQPNNSGYYNWGNTPVYSLYYIKIIGALDDPNAPPVPGATDVDKKVICQTTGIETRNGTTSLHVLTNLHVFVRF